jgi:hypothetical protein
MRLVERAGVFEGDGERFGRLLETAGAPVDEREVVGELDRQRIRVIVADARPAQGVGEQRLGQIEGPGAREPAALLRARGEGRTVVVAQLGGSERGGDTVLVGGVAFLAELGEDVGDTDADVGLDERVVGEPIVNVPGAM